MPMAERALPAPFRRAPGAAVALVVLVAIFAASSGGRFLSVGNLVSLSSQVALLLLVALPMTFVVLTEGLDLSVGALMGLAGVVAATAMLGGWGVPGALLAALGTGLVLGAVNGALIAWGGMPAFVVTLGTMGLAEGLALAVTDGEPVSGFGDAPRLAWQAMIGPVPLPVAVAAALYALLHLLLYRTPFGAHVVAVGGNREALRLAGIRGRAVHAAVYVLSASCAALAAFLLVGRTNAAHPTVALGVEFDAIVAVVLGGTSFERGQGWLFGTVLGAAAIGVLRNGLNVLAVDPSLQVVAVGLLAILALVAGNRRGGRART
ncbi:ABC transporter permease [Roseomonas sp. NAR14]|uniref:ABC transporter permease n=1 Tax=Roseomonas acroporae TaxID=2937791 RepID=A0A9X1YGX3_9PROT|nr:ABC transporter permease [Roseomonas acroporae]MCK8786076.1 ABC transporter permease [Roseomonas acroporae]